MDLQMQIDTTNTLGRNAKETNQMKDIKQIKKHLGIGNAQISKEFGYKTPACYANSSAKKRLEKGIEYIFNAVQSRK